MSCRTLRHWPAPDTLVLSIMAGKTLGFLQAGLPNAAIVRAMPNTPAAIGRGITVAVPNAGGDGSAEAARARPSRGVRGRGMDRRRKPDGCGDRRLGLGTGLCLPARGSAGARPAWRPGLPEDLAANARA